MNNFFWGATWDLAIRKVSVVAICGPCVSYSHSCCGAHDGVECTRIQSNHSPSSGVNFTTDFSSLWSSWLYVCDLLESFHNHSSAIDPRQLPEVLSAEVAYFWKGGCQAATAFPRFCKAMLSVWVRPSVTIYQLTVADYCGLLQCQTQLGADCFWPSRPQITGQTRIIRWGWSDPIIGLTQLRPLRGSRRWRWFFSVVSTGQDCLARASCCAVNEFDI